MRSNNPYHVAKIHYASFAKSKEAYEQYDKKKSRGDK